MYFIFLFKKNAFEIHNSVFASISFHINFRTAILYIHIYLLSLTKYSLIFSISYPYIYILVIFLLAALFAFLLYGKSKSQFPKTILWIITSFRFLGVFVLLFLLLSPIFRYKKEETIKPSLIILQDNSESIKYGWKNSDSSIFRKSLNDLIEKLNVDFNVIVHPFGYDITDTIRYDYTEKQTDISESINSIFLKYEHQNIGGVILASDGIYNKGFSPLQYNFPSNANMYCIGLGDTNTQQDLLVARVFANQIVYKGDAFVLKGDVVAFNCVGKTMQIQITEINTGKTLASKAITINKNNFSYTIESIIQAESAGIKKYNISVVPLENEQNIINNNQQISVEVLDNKENILLVANAPHPDINAIKEALINNKNYKLEICMADKLPSKTAQYNLIILHNLPSVKNPISTLVSQAKESGTSIWYIAGLQSAHNLLNSYQQSINIVPRTASAADIGAEFNNNFNLFNNVAENNKTLATLPPLQNIYGEYKAGNNTHTLLFQKNGNIVTNNPLWLLANEGKQRIGVLAGEGLWRWRMHNFLQTKNHKTVDDLIQKSVQFLSVKKDKKNFRIQTNKNIYSQFEPIVFDAEFYNDNYENINTPDVMLQIKNDSGWTMKYTLNKNANAYSLNIGTLSAGKYEYNAQTNFNNTNYTATGTFNVENVNTEMMNTRADWGMMKQLAENNNGHFFYINQMKSISDSIQNNKRIKSIIRTEVMSKPLIDWKWIFGLIVLLFSTEWFLRKRNGAY